MEKVDNDSPFVTTSDIIHHLNKALQEVNGSQNTINSEARESPPQQQKEDFANASKSLNNENIPHFELQRRLPDGSTRKATTSEQKAADLESKLQQVAGHVSQLSYIQQWQWMQDQKEYGNRLYAQKDYPAAIDVYLTVVMMQQNLQQTQENQSSSEREGEKNEYVYIQNTEHHTLLFLQCMNNLAQSALKMAWYSKAVQFAHLGFQRLQKNDEDPCDNSLNAFVSFQFGKLCFKRAKAHRKRGEYSDARGHLRRATTWLDRSAEQYHELLTMQTNTERGTKITAMNQSNDDHFPRRLEVAHSEIAHEHVLVQSSLTEARDNEHRQQCALQRAFAPSTQFTNPANRACLPNTNKTNNDTRHRTYSTLQAPSIIGLQTEDAQDPLDHTNDNGLSFWRVQKERLILYGNYYLSIIGSVAEELLVWMGDPELLQRRRFMDQRPRPEFEKQE